MIDTVKTIILCLSIQAICLFANSAQQTVFVTKQDREAIRNIQSRTNFYERAVVTNGTENFRLDDNGISISNVSLKNLTFPNGSVSNYFWGKEIIVDSEGKGNFSTIQGAVDYIDGIHDTNDSIEISVRVVAGSYYENVVVRKKNIIIRGDDRRSKLWGSLTIMDSPTFVSGLYIRSVDGKTPVTYTNVNSSVLGSLHNCYILNAINVDTNTYCFAVANCNVKVNLNNTELYTANRHSGENAKSVLFYMSGPGGGNLEVHGCRLKTSSLGPEKNNDEILAILDGTSNMQIENSTWTPVHDEYPSVIINDNSWVGWFESACETDQNLDRHIEVKGTSPNKIWYYPKEVGSLKVTGNLRLGTGDSHIRLFSDGTNTFQEDVNSVTSMLLTANNGGLTNENDSIALNALSIFADTNRVETLWSRDRTEFRDATGGVWRIYTIVSNELPVVVTQHYDTIALDSTLTNYLKQTDLSGTITNIIFGLGYVSNYQENVTLGGVGLGTYEKDSIAASNLFLGGTAIVSNDLDVSGATRTTDLYAERIGVKTNTPQEALHINGNALIESNLTASSVHSTSGDLYLQGTNFGPRIVNSITNGQDNVTLAGTVFSSTGNRVVFPNNATYIRSDGTLYGHVLGTYDAVTAQLVDSPVYGNAPFGLQFGSSAMISWSAAQMWAEKDTFIYRDSFGTVGISSNLVVIGTNTAYSFSTTNFYGLGPTIANAQLNLFSDGTNTFSKDVNGSNSMFLTTSNGGITNGQDNVSFGTISSSNLTSIGTVVMTNGSVFIQGAENREGHAPLVVQNTTPYSDPWSQYAQIWLNSAGVTFARMRVDGTFMMNGRIDGTHFNADGSQGAGFNYFGNAGASIYGGVLTTPTWGIDYPALGIIDFNTYGTNRMRIGADGDITISNNLTVARTNTAYEIFASNTAHAKDFLLSDELGMTDTINVVSGIYRNYTDTNPIVVVDPNVSIYKINVSEPSAFSNDLSRLNLNNRIAEWELWINFTSTNALSSTFQGFEFQHETDFSVTGCYKFVCSTTDGITVQARQTYPTIYEVNAVPYCRGDNNFAYSAYLNVLDDGTTNGAVIAFLKPDKHTYYMVKMNVGFGNPDCATNTVSIRVGTSVYGGGDRLLPEVAVSLQNPSEWWAGATTGFIMFPPIATNGWWDYEQITHWGFFEATRLANNGNVSCQRLFLRQANELEIKAWEQKNLP